AEARHYESARPVSIRFEDGYAERLAVAPAACDLVISRHVLWTLAHPEAAIDEWMGVLRPGGRLVIVDGQFDAGAGPPPPGSARTSAEYATIGDQLPFPRRPLPRADRSAVDSARPGERRQRSPAGSRRGPGAAHGRRRTRAP